MHAAPGSSRRLLVALDVDGTIMDADERISPAVRVQLSRVTALLDELELAPAYAVCCNGAVILRRDQKGAYGVATAHTFDPAAALRILRLADPGAMYAVEDHTGEFLLTRRVDGFGTQGPSRLSGFDELLSARALRIIAVSPRLRSPEVLDQLQLLGLRPVPYAVGRRIWLDIAPAGVDKAAALERVRGLLGVDRADVVAIGDGANDVEMLRWAAEHGRGFAIGHAPREVRAAASATTGSVEEDGAASALATL